MAMQAEVLNQWLVNKLFDDDGNQSLETPYIYTSFSLVSSSNPYLANHQCLANNLCLADISFSTDNFLLSWFLPN